MRDVTTLVMKRARCLVEGAGNQSTVVDKQAEDVVEEGLDVEVEVVEVEDVEVAQEGMVAEDKVADVPQVDLIVFLRILHP